MARIKKMESGGKSSLGMKSVKAGYDSNPGVTRADIIVAAKKEAKGGVKLKKSKGGSKLKKQAAVAIAMKKAGKSPKKAMGGMKMMKHGGKTHMKKAMGGYKTMKGGGKMDKCRGGCY